MQKRKLKNNQMRFVIILLLFITVGFAFFWGIDCLSTPANADIVASNISDDFDGTDFDINDYNLSSSDYSLKVIQIAEGSNNRLYVYVNHIGADCVYPTTIRLAVYGKETQADNVSWNDYSLTHIAEYMYVHKYVVEGLSVSTSSVRYYDIPAIHRKYLDWVDEAPKDNNIPTEVAFEVGQLWTATTNGNTVNYEMKYMDSVLVTDMHVGSLMYMEEGGLSNYDVTYTIYIAFNTNVVMQDLLEADVAYDLCWYTDYLGFEVLQADQQTTIHADDYAQADYGMWWWHGTHKWSLIQSAETFANTENLTTEAKNKVENMSWVLRFYSNTITYNNTTHKLPQGNYAAKDTTILRLKYKTDGVTYNVGVVSNKQTGGQVVDGGTTGREPDDSDKSAWDKFLAFMDSVGNWFKKYGVWLGIGIVSVILLIILAPFLPTLFSGLVHLFAMLFKGLWWLISAPVRLIMSLFDKE